VRIEPATWNKPLTRRMAGGGESVEGQQASLCGDSSWILFGMRKTLQLRQ